MKRGAPGNGAPPETAIDGLRTGNLNAPVDLQFQVRSTPEIAEAILGGIRHPDPDEIPEIRHLWWRLRRRGHALPAERGLIAIDGRAS